MQLYKLSKVTGAVTERRSHPAGPSIEDLDACFVVKDGPARNSALYITSTGRGAKLLTKGSRGRIAINFAKLPELLTCPEALFGIFWPAIK
jgi:hypothetical protein